MFSGILAVVLTLLLSVPVFAADYAKSPIALQASQILSADQLKGENFQVNNKVRNDGFINFYTLKTDYGDLSAESTAELQIRINELKALTVMEELERKNVFKDSVVKGVKATGKGVKNLVTDPIDTGKDMIEGTGQFLSNIGQAIVSDDPDQDNALKVALGYDVAKRQFAYEFGINPYSDYEPVTDRLGEISRAAVAGGIVPKAALAAIDHGIATAAQISGTMHGMQQLVRDNPPNKLREINLGKLSGMGLSEALANAFLDNSNYDPYEETLLVGELESMNVPGRDAFISRASLVTEKSLALYYRSMAQMMGRYYRNVGAVKAVSDADGIVNLQLNDGGSIVLVPVDYIFWTKQLEAKVNTLSQALAKDSATGGKEIWMTGRIDPGAKAEFEKLSWQVVENANSRLLKK